MLQSKHHPGRVFCCAECRAEYEQRRSAGGRQLAQVNAGIEQIALHQQQRIGPKRTAAEETLEAKRRAAAAAEASSSLLFTPPPSLSAPTVPTEQPSAMYTPLMSSSSAPAPYAPSVPALAAEEKSLLIREIHANPPNRDMFLGRVGENDDQFQLRLTVGEPALLCVAYSLLRNAPGYDDEGAEVTVDFFFNWILILMHWGYGKLASSLVYTRSKMDQPPTEYKRLLRACELYRRGGHDAYRIMPGGLDLIVAKAIGQQYNAVDIIRDAQANAEHNIIAAARARYNDNAIELERLWDKQRTKAYVSEESRTKNQPEYRRFKEIFAYAKDRLGVDLSFDSGNRVMIAAFYFMRSYDFGKGMIM
jgi:hypothetical protein